MIKNKIIWTYWHQGFVEAPELIKHCARRWQLLHPDWEIHYLDNNNVFKYIQPLPLSKTKLASLSLAHRSDLIRTQLLIQYGGVWADPTCYPMISLNNWLNDNMQSGLFLFYKPGRDRIISNWFIASEKENVILKKLFNELCEFWENNTFINYNKEKIWFESWIKKVFNRSLISTILWFTWFTRKILRIYPYMVYHYKFYSLITMNNHCKKSWKNMPKISADGPHKLQRIGLLSPINDDVKHLIDNKTIPLFKLTWKLKERNWSPNSVLAYLFKGE